jgi:hypothetical protein
MSSVSVKDFVMYSHAISWVSCTIFWCVSVFSVSISFKLKIIEKLPTFDKIYSYIEIPIFYFSVFDFIINQDLNFDSVSGLFPKKLMFSGSFKALLMFYIVC